MMTGCSCGADYTVDNTTYMQIFTATGVSENFTLNGTDYTLQDGDTITFLEGIYENVNMIVNRAINLVASGIVQLNGFIDVNSSANITGFRVNGSVELNGNKSFLNRTNITGTLVVNGNSCAVNGSGIFSSPSSLTVRGDNVTISNSLINASASHGILVTGKNATITGNTINSNGSGILIRGNGCVASGNTIYLSKGME